jgi:hypothetical protein
LELSELIVSSSGEFSEGDRVVEEDWMATNNIFTVAGTGAAGFSGDNGPATSAEINQPTGVAPLPDPSGFGTVFLISDGANHRVRLVGFDGTISTVAGNGAPGFSGDGGPATSAQLNGPEGLSVNADGSFLITDHFNHVIRLVSPNGTISTVAGNGTSGFSGDGGPATQAQLNAPVSVSATADGGFLIGDSLNHVVRRVASDGTITTVAGTPGTAGFIGDGGPAVDAQLDHPDGVAAKPDGGFIVADANNNVVRRVLPDGTIDTVVGNVSAGFSGDGGTAISAQLDHPVGVASAPGDGCVVTEKNNNRIRHVSGIGRITTIAGNGTGGSAGDGGLATLAELDGPVAVAVTVDGGVLVATLAGSRIRFVAAGL